MREPNILDYLPEFLKQVREIMAYADSMNPELTNLWEDIKQVWDEQFLYTMGQYGIERWEKMLEIVPYAADTLEDRRFRIINRLNSNIDYTYRRVYDHLKQMCHGEAGFTMEYIAEIWTLQVRVLLHHQQRYKEMREWLTEVIPLNIILDIDLLYNTHRVLSKFTHRYLSQYTHGGLRITPLPDKQPE